MTRVFGVLCFVRCISDFCLGLLCAIEVLLVKRDSVLKFLTCILWLCAIFGVLVVESCLQSFYSDFKDLRKVGGGCCYMISNLRGLQGVENVQGEEEKKLDVISNEVNARSV